MTFLPWTHPKSVSAHLLAAPADTTDLMLQRTAKDCIAHLKALRLPPMTFLPPDPLKASTSQPCRSAEYG